MSKSPVEFVLPEVQSRLLQWELIRAAVDGEEAVKKLGDRVLPRPNAADKSAANLARYDAYLFRAFWYGFSGRTLTGLTGYVFAKEPVVKLPATLAVLETNVDGAGVTLAQQAKATMERVLAYGRAGLLVDYPSVQEATTQQQVIDGNISPTIVLYEPWQITNWRYSFVGSKAYLDLLVLKETASERSTDNEFEPKTITQYRVLTRDESGVKGRIFRQSADGGEFQEVVNMTYEPKDQSGNPLKEITFTFVGAKNNDSAVDAPPLGDLVSLNYAHFRNSADYEDSCYLVGQPTPWVSGLSESWAKEILGDEIQLGSRAVLRLPVGGAAGLIQAESNSLPKEAMEMKEKMAVALGAKLVEQKEVQRTATEAGMSHASEVSTLTAAATNVFLAYKTALGFCGLFVGADTALLEFDLAEPLTRDIITPEQATALLGMWQGGLIDFEEARWSVKKAGLAWKEDEEVKENNAADDFVTKPLDELPPEPGEGDPPIPAAE